MASVTYQAVLQQVADALHVTVAEIAPEWPSICAKATTDAFADMTTALALKGYSQSQISAADQFAAWVERLAFFYAGKRGSLFASYSQESLKDMDPREMLKEAVAILVLGVPTAPDGTSQIGAISSGRVGAVDAEFRRLDRRGNRWGW